MNRGIDGQPETDSQRKLLSNIIFPSLPCVNGSFPTLTKWFYRKEFSRFEAGHQGYTSIGVLELCILTVFSAAQHFLPLDSPATPKYTLVLSPQQAQCGQILELGADIIPAFCRAVDLSSSHQ